MSLEHTLEIEGIDALGTVAIESKIDIPDGADLQLHGDFEGDGFVHIVIRITPLDS